MAAHRVSFHTLGCRLNQAETALMAESFRRRGYVVEEHGRPVEVAVVHTCSVTERADARCRQVIRQVRRAAPGAVVCAVGCWAQSEPERVAGLGGVDLVVGNEEKYRLPDLIAEFVSGGRGRVHVRARPDGFAAPYPPAGFYGRSTRAHLKVQDGCDFVCAFCLLPRVRGRGRSRPFGAVLAEARELLRRGHRELVVTGVNVGCYVDGGRRLADVLWAVAALPGVLRVRLSSIEPSTVDRGILHWLARCPAACPHLHVPLQSGDDGILQAMRRHYTVDAYRGLVERILAARPDTTLGTDVIVGFPGEGEEAFARTRRLLEELPFGYVHVFTYSDRPRTAAARRQGKVPPAVKEGRSRELRALARAKKRRFLAAQCGREVSVLLETADADGRRKGLTPHYVRVAVPAAAGRENECVRVLVTGATDAHCVGTVVAREREVEAAC